MDHDHAFQTYLRLAVVSQEKGQLQGRDRFLLLAADEAAHAGLLDFSERLRIVLLSTQPRHLLSRYDSYTAAAQSEELKLLVKQMRRLCGVEKAEAIVERQLPPAETERLPYRESVESLVVSLEKQ